jgi:2-amino-4-hydroxy-6-hydroxymethyldihydropteridine diphosphokinase
MSAYRSGAIAMADALVALGGNIGDVRSTLERAIAQFCDGTTVRLLARSSDYKTPPWGVGDQPWFVNCAILVETTLSPEALLGRAQATENAFGRDRAGERRWGPRTLDIDLIAYDDLALDTPDLTLPHPRWRERAFVLLPLADIAPGRVIAGVLVSDALARVDSSGIERLPPRSGTAHV